MIRTKNRPDNGVWGEGARGKERTKKEGTRKNEKQKKNKKKSRSIQKPILVGILAYKYTTEWSGLGEVTNYETVW